MEKTQVTLDPAHQPHRPYKASFGGSFRHALEGLQYVLIAERNARVHLAIAALVVLLGLWLQLGLTEWALIILAISLVFAGEMVNTVVELTIDMITLEYHPMAKRAKDVAAGTILVTAADAVIIGVLVLGPRLWERLVDLVAR